MFQLSLSQIDPKQLVFTSNQGKVVDGVLSGAFDAGFVRTDQIEGSTDRDGNPLDPNLFRVIDAKPNLTINGVPFPFESSTPLYPEWNVAALRHVPSEVSRQVQDAMLALATHAKLAQQIQDCLEENNNTQTQATICSWDDRDKFPLERCDTTREIAEIALDASNMGEFSAWQTTQSYMQLRSMQEVTGFIAKDPVDNVWKCTRSTTLYDDITCPAGYYKQSEQDVNNGCAQQGLECQEGFQCRCSPCHAIVDCVDAVEIRGTCVSYSVFLPAILVPFFLMCAILVHFYVEYRRKQADSVWAVEPNELKFDNPSKVIGRGTFGFVLLAEYRGTQVRLRRPRWLYGSKASMAMAQPISDTLL